MALRPHCAALFADDERDQAKDAARNIFFGRESFGGRQTSLLQDAMIAHRAKPVME
jgi:predicted alpha/beta-hydrolase family hydrolase